MSRSLANAGVVGTLRQERGVLTSSREAAHWERRSPAYVRGYALVDGVSAPARVPAQARERWTPRLLLRARASFSARALRTKLCMRTSFRTQNSLSRRAMRRGMRVASCTSSSSCWATSLISV